MFVLWAEYLQVWSHGPTWFRNSSQLLSLMLSLLWPWRDCWLQEISSISETADLHRFFTQSSLRVFTQNNVNNKQRSLSCSSADTKVLRRNSPTGSSYVKDYSNSDNHSLLWWAEKHLGINNTSKLSADGRQQYKLDFIPRSQEYKSEAAHQNHSLP